MGIASAIAAEAAKLIGLKREKQAASFEQAAHAAAGGKMDAKAVIDWCEKAGVEITVFAARVELLEKRSALRALVAAAPALAEEDAGLDREIQKAATEYEAYVQKYQAQMQPRAFRRQQIAERLAEIEGAKRELLKTAPAEKLAKVDAARQAVEAAAVELHRLRQIVERGRLAERAIDNLDQMQHAAVAVDDANKSVWHGGRPTNAPDERETYRQRIAEAKAAASEIPAAERAVAQAEDDVTAAEAECLE